MIRLISLPFLFLITMMASAQTRVNMKDVSQFTLVNRTLESSAENGRTMVSLNEAAGQGLAILKDVSFSGGTLEFDVKGRNVLQRSFVGVAFYVQDNQHYEAIYFRPFNFMNPDTVRRHRAVQYIFEPEYPWDRLRETYPGKYEHTVNPVPDGDAWFHAKVVVDGKNVRVYVDHSPTPSLQVTRIGNATTGKVALWTGEGSNGSFANLVITEAPKKSK